MNTTLNPNKLLPGDIIHVRGNALFPSRAIRFCLNNNVWGNHDALVIAYNGHLFVGETQPPWSRIVDLDDYNRDIEQGRIEVRVLRVPHATETQRLYASYWWVNNVQGRLYDFAAYPRLIGKCIANGFLNLFRPNRWRELINTEAGWKWASFCSEGVADAWAAAGYDICPGVANPTPLHIEIAERAGRLIRVQ
ncbi:MAG: hypothetical protein QXT45_07440 [Candidatus Bilamarchaeaceae archaeon]